MTHSVESMKAALRGPRVQLLAEAMPTVAEDLEDPQTLEELRAFFAEELAVLRAMERKWADPAARERALNQVRAVLAKVEAVRANQEFQEWMAELPEELEGEGRRLEAAAFGLEDADGFQAFAPGAARVAPARSPLLEMAAKKPVAKKPVPKKPVAKKPAPKRAPPKRAPPKRAPARPVARGSGSSVTSQIGFGGYVKENAPKGAYRSQSFSPGDIGVLPPLGVWDPP